ncbi:MAG: ribonuclease P protein component [Dictyoglomus sp.]|nr:ribonuclease P protein component [Dictyoglomus sp.]MCX7845653.1 ribonuclease P protein component [Dictyoglomaceae bacterium]MDW8189148.1 ribonuclease P protein component [Dictyoglomus sp.]
MSLFSFPKHERLKKKKDFKRIIKEGRVYTFPPFMVYIRRGSDVRKIGIIVNKKVGSAVVRNRLKRLVREVYRLNRPYLVDDVEMIVIIKPSDRIIKNFWEMEKILKKIWQNANIFKDVEKSSNSSNKIL